MPLSVSGGLNMPQALALGLLQVAVQLILELEVALSASVLPTCNSVGGAVPKEMPPEPEPEPPPPEEPQAERPRGSSKKKAAVALWYLFITDFPGMFAPPRTRFAGQRFALGCAWAGGL